MKKKKKGRLPRIEEENSAEKTLPLLCFQLYFLPLFCSLFCRNSAATFPYYLVFSCHNMLPFEVCFTGIRAWFKERVLGRKFEDKADDSLKKKPWPTQAI
jgi:hypothetical protein